MTLTVGSLFSGIGGLDLGLERAGMRVIWQSEIDPYATRVLAKHWPGVPNYGDITRIDWGHIVRPDVICGGYPCQPFSTAGQRKGEEDPRHLWPWVREALRVLRPRYAILENVRGHLSLGGTTVLSEIAALGYSAEWRVVSAASVGANHRRDRVIIVAYPSDLLGDGGHNYPGIGVGSETLSESGDGSRAATLADAEVYGGYGRRHPYGMEASAKNWIQSALGGSGSHYRGGENWQTEPDVGRVADGVPSRVDRLKGLGNAVVPQVAEVIGRLVVAHHEQNPD